MEDRKIMVEVTEEEYELIKLGVLNEGFETPKYEDLRKELLNEITEEDAKTIFEKHNQFFLGLATDQEIVGEIVNRTKNKTNTALRDPVSNQDFVVAKGQLKGLTKRDFSQIGEPIVVNSEDEFSWTLKIIEEKLR